MYTVVIKNCDSLNVFSGRNDVGKSNIIKALNLFFTETTDLESEFEFYENLSNKRLQEVRQESIKGRQFISVKIEFNRPKNYEKSLPEKFSVERVWYRDSEYYEQATNLNSSKLPSTLITAQRSLSTFLNKIHFEYVPAIRDRNYTGALLSRLQSNLLATQIVQDKALFSTASSLATHIEDQIGDLKGDFEAATKIDTTIAPPNSLSDLFQSFIVSTKTSNGNIPLSRRGDGL